MKIEIRDTIKWERNQEGIENKPNFKKTVLNTLIRDHSAPKKLKSTTKMNNLFNFQKEYEKHLESNELRAIEAEFIEKPYFIEERDSAKIAEYCSYFFNFLSVATASTLLYLTLIKFFALSLPYQVIAGIFILLVLTIFEYWKRKHTNKAFKDYYRNEADRQHNYSAIAKMCVFILISIISSTWGAKKGTVEFAPTAPIIATDSLLEAKRAYLASLNTQIEDARNTKWKGTTTQTSQRTINALASEKITVTTDISDLEKSLDQKNLNIESKHQGETTETSYFFACLAICIELAFLGCIAYLWKFRKKVIFEVNLYRGTLKTEHYIFNNDEANEPKITQKTDTKLLAESSLSSKNHYPSIAASSENNLPSSKTDNKIKSKSKKQKKKKKKKPKPNPIGFFPTIKRADNNFTKSSDRQEVDGENDDTKTLNVPKSENAVKTIDTQLLDSKNDDLMTLNVPNNNTRQCKHCSKSFTYKHWAKVYCSDTCRKLAWQKRKSLPNKQ